MEVLIHGNRMTVGDDLRSMADEKIARAVRVFGDIQHIDLEFSKEQNPRMSEERYRVEITSQVAGNLVRVEASGFDDRTALDVAVDKYERQLRRLKQRLIDRGRRSTEKHLNAPPGGVEEHSDAAELRIDRVKQFDVKPMSPEEAALQMELLGHSFYLFLNAETERYSVLYRRRGGSLGLLEPR